MRRTSKQRTDRITGLAAYDIGAIPCAVEEVSMFHWPGGRTEFQCAIEAAAGAQPCRITLVLTHDDPNEPAPPIDVIAEPPFASNVTVETGRIEPTKLRVTLTLPPIGAIPVGDKEPQYTLRIAAVDGQLSACTIVVRYCRCIIRTTLVETHSPVRLQTRAALLWRSWNRYEEIVFLKSFRSGLSGSDVFVVRPRLKSAFRESAAPGAVAAIETEVWGSYLLVKTGPVTKIEKEWDCFQKNLLDRQHPFMAGCDEYLDVLPADGPDSDDPGLNEPQATLISLFLGGDLIRVQPLEQLFGEMAEAQGCEQIIHKLFTVMSNWYAGHTVRPLGEWNRMFEIEGGKLRLFGKFDLRERADRDKYAGAITWDNDFKKKKHLCDHLLGPAGKQNGLLYRLMTDIHARYSVIHGDMQPRNILVDESNVWLIDFGETGVGVTLYDFAKLEVYLRLWCVRFDGRSETFEAQTTLMESHLLDRLIGSASGVQPIVAAAADLGAAPRELQAAAACIIAIRDQAVRYSLGRPDRRDYLAVLYLTVLYSLRYVGQSTGAAGRENFRWLMTLYWVLEDTVCRLVDMMPYPREQQPMHKLAVLNANWIDPPDAPRRVVYFLNREDGKRALAPLAASRGVLQNQNHHLDVLDHSLLTLAYVERMLEDEDPIAGFLDPCDLSRRVHDDLLRQGIALPPGAARSCCDASDSGAGPLTDDMLNDVRQLLRRSLDSQSRQLLKWAALFHDVGKPATRTARWVNGRLDVCCFGHELHALPLIEPHLVHLFDKKEVRGRLQKLIEYHHMHHTLMEHYRGGDAAEAAEHRAALFRILADNRIPHNDPLPVIKHLKSGSSDSRPDFPLLMLLGFADVMACAGVAASDPKTMGPIDLAQLTLAARFEKLSAAAAVAAAAAAAAAAAKRPRKP